MSKVILYKSEIRAKVEDRITREVITFNELNNKGEKIQIELCYNYHDNTSKNSLPVLWKKHGYIDRVLTSYITIDTYATDKNGNCWGKYNPQVKENGRTINFNYMLEVNKQNREKLIDEVYKLAFED